MLPALQPTSPIYLCNYRMPCHPSPLNPKQGIELLMNVTVCVVNLPDSVCFASACRMSGQYPGSPGSPRQGDEVHVDRGSNRVGQLGSDTVVQ